MFFFRGPWYPPFLGQPWDVSKEMFEILEAMDEEAIEPDSVTHSIIVPGTWK